MAKKTAAPRKEASRRPKAEPTHIGELVADPRNARKHSPRNIGEIGDSLSAVGAARSIVIDENNVVLAGNGLIEAAAERGITKLRVVEADGETVVAVRRRGLTPRQKAELAVRDNRAGESADWDVEILDGLAEEHALDLGQLGFTDAELEALRGADDSAAAGEAGTGGDPGDGRYKEQYGVIVLCAGEEEQRETFEALQAQFPGREIKVVTT